MRSVLPAADNDLNCVIVILYQVIVNCPTSGCEQKFRCGKWLALDEGDRVIERTLYETSRRMREKSAFIFSVVQLSQMLSVCLCVCLSDCLSVWMLTIVIAAHGHL